MKSGNGMAGTGTSPWRCWPTPAWRWSGARRWNKEVRGKRGLSQLGRKADTPDGARGPAVALPADMETSTYGRISAAVVPVETAAPGNGPALPLPTPPETPHHISATVVLSPNPPKGYGGGVDTGDDGYGKANGPGPVPIDGVEGSARWPRQWPGGGRQWRRPAKTARRHAGSGTGGLGWHEFAGQPLGLSGGRVGRRRRAVRLVGEWRAIGPGRN